MHELAVWGLVDSFELLTFLLHKSFHLEYFRITRVSYYFAGNIKSGAKTWYESQDSFRQKDKIRLCVIDYTEKQENKEHIKFQNI